MLSIAISFSGKAPRCCSSPYAFKSACLFVPLQADWQHLMRGQARVLTVVYKFILQQPQRSRHCHLIHSVHMCCRIKAQLACTQCSDRSFPCLSTAKAGVEHLGYLSTTVLMLQVVLQSGLCDLEPPKPVACPLLSGHGHSLLQAAQNGSHV